MQGVCAREAEAARDRECVGRPRSRLMDPTIGWDQPEQFGPAKDLWLRIWEAEKGFDILTLRQEQFRGGVMGNKDYLPLDTVNNQLSGSGGVGVGGGGGLEHDRTSNQQQQRPFLQHNTCSNYYNPSRRKSDNRASTYGMNYNHDALIGEYGGCPWRIPNKHYSTGIIGSVILTFIFISISLFKISHQPCVFPFIIHSLIYYLVHRVSSRRFSKILFAQPPRHLVRFIIVLLPSS